MFQIRESTRFAKARKVPKQKQLPDIKPNVSYELPFASLCVGQSFFLTYAECLPKLFKLALERVRRYNQTYNVTFVAIKHKNPKQLEIARIG